MPRSSRLKPKTSFASYLLLHHTNPTSAGRATSTRMTSANWSNRTLVPGPDTSGCVTQFADQNPSNCQEPLLNTVKVAYYCAGVYHLSRGHHSASARAVGWLQHSVRTSTAKISHAAGMDAMDGEN